MVTLQRTAHQRATMAMDRIRRLLNAPATAGDHLTELHSDLVRAFEMAERVGEVRGAARATAMAKLSEDDKRALGLLDS